MYTAADLQFLRTVCNIAHEAGRAAMMHYDAPDATDKPDGSPVTLADLAADAVIEDGLKRAFAHIPRVSEEGASSLSPQALQQGEFFLIDPLDGTKEFIKRNGEFTVNIALIKNREPVSAIRTDHGMGHRRRTCSVGCCGRRGDAAGRNAVAVCESGILQS